jgi:hypothetical protein
MVMTDITAEMKTYAWTTIVSPWREAMIDQCAGDRQAILRALDVKSSGASLATAWPSQNEVLWASASIYSRAFQLSSKIEPTTSLDSQGGGDNPVGEINGKNGAGAEKEVKKIGEQSMVQKGALWWSVEENLQEDDMYDSSYNEAGLYKLNPADP